MKLNKAQLAALAAGATQAEIAALASASDTTDENTETPEVKAARIAAEAEAARVAAEAETARIAAEAAAADPAAAAAAAAAAPAAQDTSALVAHLTGQLTEANTALVAAKVEAETFKTQAASVDGLVNTLRAALGEKLVALGASADAAAGYSAANIVAEYSRIDAVFKTQFRVGGVAAVASPEPKDTKAAVDPMLAEALKHSLIK